MRQTPQLDADLILCHVLGVSRTWLFLHNDDVLTTEQEAAIEAALEKRLGGLPVAYITGEKEFYGRTFFVTQDVLIPKPDTELLVEKAVAYAKAAFGARASSEAERSRLGADSGAGVEVGRQFRFADICTGSGCIAISVLAELFAELSGQDGCAGDAFERVHADATDISAVALAVARKNAEALLGCEGARSLQFHEGDLCGPLMACGSKGGACGGVSQSADGGASGNEPIAKYDMVLSNPPYVPATVTDELLKDGRGEPRLALDGDTDSALQSGTTSCDTDSALGGDFAQGVRAADGKAADGSSGEQSSDGLAIIRRLIPQVKKILLPGGVFFMETGEYNAEKAAEYLSKCGFTDIVIHRDLAGQLRLVESHI